MANRGRRVGGFSLATGISATLATDMRTIRW